MTLLSGSLVDTAARLGCGFGVMVMGAAAFLLGAAGSPRSPDILDVSGSRLFDQAFVRTESQPFQRVVVRFPLPDRTALEYDPAPRRPTPGRPLYEVEPHWYRDLRRGD